MSQTPWFVLDAEGIDPKQAFQEEHLLGLIRQGKIRPDTRLHQKGGKTVFATLRSRWSVWKLNGREIDLQTLLPLVKQGQMSEGDRAVWLGCDSQSYASEALQRLTARLLEEARRKSSSVPIPVPAPTADESAESASGQDQESQSDDELFQYAQEEETAASSEAPTAHDPRPPQARNRTAASKASPWPGRVLAGGAFCLVVVVVTFAAYFGASTPRALGDSKLPPNPPPANGADADTKKQLEAMSKTLNDLSLQIGAIRNKQGDLENYLSNLDKIVRPFASKDGTFSDALKKTEEEILAKVGDQVKGRNDSLIKDNLQALRMELKAAQQDFIKEALAAVQKDKTIWDEAKKSFALPLGPLAAGLEKLDGEQKAVVGRLDGMERSLGRLRDAIALPTDDKLFAVLYVLEGGGRMSEYQFENARSVLLQAVTQAVRQTPNREVGLMSAREKTLLPIFKLEKHGEGDLVELRDKIRNTTPVGSEDVRWQTACEQGIDHLVTRPAKQRRLVYLTCNPTIASGLDAAKLSDAAVRQGVEVWVVQFVKGKDVPSQELSQVASETGGQFVTVFAGRDGTDAKRKAADRRLSSVLFEALDLRASGE